ncbi:hypothetical protein KQI52_11110 [bacterium]|nr:hypothetical protein [bacterium]
MAKRNNADLHVLSRSRLNLLVLLSLLLVVSAFVSTASAKDESWDWQDETSLTLNYQGGYDSNILELSEEDIDRFDNGELPLATDVEAYDDFVQSLGVYARLSLPKLWGWRDGSISYSFNYLSFAKNPYNDRPIHNLYFTHDILNRTDIFFSYLYIPERYLRDYYDRDSGQIIGTQFDYDLLGGGVQYSPEFLKGMRLSARYEYFTIYYNKYFTEYDSEGWGLRFDLRYKVNKVVTLTGIVKRRWSDNVGFDQHLPGSTNDPGQTDSEYGDGSYGEEWFELVADLNIYDLLPNRIDLSLSARLRHRFYDSELSVTDDPVHAGREHNHWRFGLETKTKIIGNLYGGPSVEYEFRRTDSPVDWLKERKDFDAIRASLNLSYRLW